MAVKSLESVVADNVRHASPALKRLVSGDIDVRERWISRLKDRPPVPLAICFHREAVAHNRNDD